MVGFLTLDIVEQSLDINKLLSNLD
jgi:hypothetical protein